MMKKETPTMNGKISDVDIENFREQAVGYLTLRGFRLEDVKFGVDAWHIAHGVGFTSYCYDLDGIVDAHIVTAMGKVFPNVVFKDKYRY
jgi:hypothetical protein